MSDMVTVRTTIHPATPQEVTAHERECLRALGILLEDAPAPAQRSADDPDDTSEGGEPQDPPAAPQERTRSRRAAAKE